MPSRKRGELILFSSDDPKPLVSWLIETHGLQNILRLLSEHQSGGTRIATKTSSKKGGSKKGGKKLGRPKGSKNVSKKGGKRGRKAAKGSGNIIGNG